MPLYTLPFPDMLGVMGRGSGGRLGLSGVGWLVEPGPIAWLASHPGGVSRDGTGECSGLPATLPGVATPDMPTCDKELVAMRSGAVRLVPGRETASEGWPLHAKGLALPSCRPAAVEPPCRPMWSSMLATRMSCELGDGTGAGDAAHVGSGVVSSKSSGMELLRCERRTGGAHM